MKKFIELFFLAFIRLLALAIIAVGIVGTLNTLFHLNLTLRLGPPGSSYTSIPTNFIDLFGTEMILAPIFLIFYAVYKIQFIKEQAKKNPQIAAGIAVLVSTILGIGIFLIAKIIAPPPTYDTLLSAVLDNKLQTVESIIDQTPFQKEKSFEILNAALFDDPHILELLVMRGYSINAKNNEGKTVLDIAKSLGNQELVDKLIKLGAE